MLPFRALSTLASHALRRAPTTVNAVCAARPNLGSLRSKGTRAGNGCFKCGSSAHWAANCTQPSKCYRCGEEGHISTACTNTGTDLRGKIRCFNCGEEDHRAKDCPKPQACYRCGAIGHISEKCTEPRDPERPFEREPLVNV